MLHNIRQGSMNKRSDTFWLGRCLEILNRNEHEIFKRVLLYLMPTLDMTTVEVLQ